MRNLIIKTFLKTLIAVIVVTVFFLFSLYLFAPSFAADKCFDLGLEKVSLKLTEKAYKKSGKIEDLAAIVERAIVINDSEIVLDYALKLLLSDGFENYSKHQDETKNADVKGGYRDYIVSNYAIYAYENDKKILAKNVALEEINVSYSEFNAFRILLLRVLERGDNEFCADLIKELKKIGYSNEIIENDIALADARLNN